MLDGSHAHAPGDRPDRLPAKSQCQLRSWGCAILDTQPCLAVRYLQPSPLTPNRNQHLPRGILPNPQTLS